MRKAPNAVVVTPGERYGLLTVVKEVERIDPHLRRVLCACECGGTITTLLKTLRSGGTRSCGCLQMEHKRNMHRTHGMSTLPEYRIWKQMCQRTSNPRHSAYARYGGRGIFMCNRWRHSFPAFLEDMGRRPTEQHSIDRVDNDGPYSPDNCRWATTKEQNWNTRQNIMVTYKGRTQPLPQWCEELGVPLGLIRARIREHGWTFERAVNTSKMSA